MDEVDAESWDAVRVWSARPADCKRLVIFCCRSACFSDQRETRAYFVHVVELLNTLCLGEWDKFFC